MKIALLALSAVLAAPLAAAAQSAPKAKPINYDARAKACDAKLKGQYSYETKIVARGFCLSNVQQDQYQEARR
jgi:Skp family chaperone for outer membrane proteins